MGSDKEGKRKKGKRDVDDENRKEMKSKRARTRSRSPEELRESESRRKRRHSRSASPKRPVKHERMRDETRKEAEVKQEPPVRKTKETDMLNTRTGGAYIPPARLRMMQAQITDKSSVAFQRLAWEALKKSIHGYINKINVGNIGIIIKELLKENIVRGRGLLCRSVIQAQAASPTFTNVYAALVAAVNSRFPNIGELLLKRLVIQFKRGFKRNDKPICISSASFIAHLVNQRVAHEILALELLTLLVETPTDDSVEVAISFLKECGQKLTEVSSKGVNAIFEMLRNILHEGQLDKRVQYMIEVMFQVWKDGFKDHPALIEELELVPEEEQFTHLLMLDDATDAQDILNVFKLDEKYEDNEQKYKTLCKEILGSDAETDEEGSGESGSEEEDEDEENQEQKPMTIIDNTETNLVALRRTVYLTINSSLDFEECAHKLMKMQLKPGQEVELCHMFLDCCAEQRTYEKFYGLLAQRFCNINRIYIGPFEEIFKDSYSTAHRLDTNRLRNVSKFFAHLLFTDSISWEVLECVRLNEEDTTSSSRIYIKILFQELAEYMGLKKLNDRLQDPTLQDAFRGVFPRDNPKNTRFSINFFTSIGLGGLTDELREHLKQMPKPAPATLPAPVDSEDSESSSSSSSDDSSSSDSDSEADSSTKDKDKSKSKRHKTPKTPEEEPPKDTERWGHDGFYDTYGKDARRTEPSRQMDHNFARPRDVGRNNDDKRSDKTKEKDNFWGDRREDSRRERDDDRRSDRHDNDRRSHRREDDRRSDRRDDDRRSYRRDEDRRSDRRDEDRSDRRDDDRTRDKRDVDKTRDSREYDSGRRDRQKDKGDDVVERKGDRSKERDESTERRKDDKGRRDDMSIIIERKKDGSKGTDEGTERRKNDRDTGKNRDEKSNDRSRESDDRIDRRKYGRDGDKRKRDDNDDRQGHDKNSDRSKERDNGIERRKDDIDRDSRKNRDDDRRKEKIYEDKKESRKHGDSEDDSRSHDKNDSKSKDRSRREESKKDKDRKKSKKNDLSSTSSSDESVEKENRVKKSKRDRREEREYEENSRRKKDKRKNKKDDGWDIRGSSIRREEPNRYWEN